MASADIVIFGIWRDHSIMRNRGILQRRRLTHHYDSLFFRPTIYHQPYTSTFLFEEYVFKSLAEAKEMADRFWLARGCFLCETEDDEEKCLLLV